MAIASKYPSLKFVVQELPSMRPPSVSFSLPPEFESSVSLTTHDFFNPQSVSADVYLYRWIFHNWSDAYAIKMLQALVPVMKPGAKVLINDGVLPEAGSVSLTEDKSIRLVSFKIFFLVADQLILLTRGRTMDLLQFVLVNGREREIEEWKDLFKRADSRFEFSKAWRPEKSRMWLIEAVWKP